MVPPVPHPARLLPRPAAIVAMLVLVVLVVPSSSPTEASASAPCWLPPVAGTVVDPFRPPRCPWCAGNRGIEYATAPGAVVRAVATGVVSFSGVVVGVRYVVVDIGDARRITYGRLTSSTLRAGDHVPSGSIVGIAGGQLFFGLRVGEVHHDPAPLLGELVGRPRLVPTDGSPARPAPAPTLRCGSR